MKKLRWALLLLVLAGCGKSATGSPIQISLDEDMGTSDMMGPDVGAVDVGDDPLEETPRPDLDVVVVDREVTFADGESERLAFEVPDDAVSVMVSVTGVARTQYTLAEWTNGDGSDILARGWLDTDPGAPSMCLNCPNRVAASESSFAAILPNNEAAKLIPGTHNITAYGYTTAGFAVTPLSSGSATVRVVIKRLPAEPESGVLDLNLYLTGARGWTSETGPTDPDLQQILTELEGIYAQAGIELGVVTYNDIPEEYSVVESVAFGPDLQELFALSSDAPRNAINLFLVDELFLGNGPGFGVLLGVSGGIPGPPVSGTLRSGVAINTKGDPQLDIPTANIIAHEVGHHLGLFHSTENPQTGQLHDPIADTPQSDPSLLMYFASDGTTISATQGAVMRRNMWVNHGGEQ